MIKQMKLSDVCEIKYGKDYKKLSKGIYPLFGSSGIFSYVDQFLYNKPTVLIPRKGSIGNLFYYDKPFWSVDTMFWTIIKDNCVPKYLYYYLKTKDLSLLNSGSAVPSLTTKILYDLDILLPEYKEQRAIADVLSSFDDKIELNNKIIKNLEEQAQSLYKHWFVDFEFPDKDGKPYKSNGGKFKESELGLIPEDWEVEKLVNISDIYQPEYLSTQSLDKEGKFYVYGANGVIGKYNSYNHLEREIAVCCRGANCGNFLMTMPYSWITSNSMVIHPKIDSHDKEYLYFSFSKDKFEKFITGSAQPQITRTNLQDFKLIYPMRSLINDFEKVAFSFRLKIENLVKEIAKLTDLRDYLLPKLMNGEIKVSDIK